MNAPAEGQTTWAPVTEKTGDTVGRYKLLEKIGEGGCGIVYVAEQTEPVRRRVALKVIKLGMDTKAVVARFEAERQALAMMDHPNIAKVLDAGSTETGRPYFIMELVRGIRITEYCDQNNLSAPERLGLFIKVCQAIQHAHQKGIIHRDIKPSNILVTLHDGVPVPKVIDFGIAKATEGRLTDSTVYTQLHQFIGTPAYMSPEQAEMSGLDVDTRSDIYSLGVLLYELLTGHTPFNPEELIASGLDGMRRTIREKEPLRPSTKVAGLRGEELTTTARRRSTESAKYIHQLKGDLDWVVMRCLEKDRTRRYETANGLAADLKRHLENEPVTARPPSASYRFRKLVRRNKMAFAAAAAVAAALVAGILASTWQAVRATRAQRNEAEQRRAAEEARQNEGRQRLLAEEASRRLSQALYLSDMGVAWQSWAEGDADRTRQLLEKHRPKPGQTNDPRGFEWRYLWGVSRPDELFILTNGGACVKYSPDGRTLATTDPGTGELRLFDVRSRRTLKVLKPYDHGTWFAAFSPDGKMLATAARGAPDFKLWDVATGEQTGSLPSRNQENFCAVFSPDGKRLATVAGSFYQPIPAEVRIWDVASRTEIRSLQGLTSFALYLDFSPDSETIAVGDGEGIVRLWNVPANSVRLLRGHSGMVPAVRFTPDGKLLVTGDEKGTILVWDWAAGSIVRVLTGHQSPVINLAVTRDSQKVASGARDHTCRLWDLQTGEELARLLGHSGRVWSVDFSPDGLALATTSIGEATRIWRAAPKHEGEILTRTKGGNHIGFSPDNRFAYVDEWDLDTVKLWDLVSKTVVHSLPGRDIRFSPDGKIFTMIRDQTNVVIHDATTMRSIASIPGPARLKGGTAISPDGKWLALRSDDGPLIMDLAARRIAVKINSTGPGADAVAFTGDSRKLITAEAEDGAIRFWEVLTGRPAGQLTGHREPIQAIALSPDGLMLASAGGTTIRLWNLANGMAAEDSVLKQNTGNVVSLAFSPDNRTLAAGSFDGPIKLWNVPGRQEIGSLKAHLTVVWRVAFAPDGNSLASSSYDYTVRLWAASSFQETN